MTVVNNFSNPGAGVDNVLNLASSQWTIDGTTVTSSAAQLNKSFSGSSGSHVVTSGEGSAHTLTIATGLTTITTQVVQILRSNKVITGDATITVSGGGLTVASGSTYVMTAGDVVNYLAVGS